MSANASDPIISAEPSHALIVGDWEIAAHRFFSASHMTDDKWKGIGESSANRVNFTAGVVQTFSNGARILVLLLFAVGMLTPSRHICVS